MNDDNQSKNIHLDGIQNNSKEISQNLDGNNGQKPSFIIKQTSTEQDDPINSFLKQDVGFTTKQIRDKKYNLQVVPQGFHGSTFSKQSQRRKHYPHATREKRSKKEESSLNFKRWLLIFVSIGNLVLAPLICYMGFQASQYDYNDLLVVDKALIVLGVWVLLISIGNIISIAKENDDLMIFMFYSSIISFILLSVFAIGAISFSDNLLEFIDRHWEEIRPSAKTYSMNDFKTHVASELVSLGAFALTIDLSLFIIMATILVIQGLEKIMVALFPLTNLLFIVFSSAVIMVAVYTNQHTYYTSALPVWANYIVFLIALFILTIAIFGYYSGTRGRYAFILIYILVLTLSSFICLITGLGMIIKTSNIKDAVSKEWPTIQLRLKEAGYDIGETTFANFLEINVKFAGLFIIVFCLFLVVGLIPAIYLSFSLRKRSSIPSINIKGARSFRLNSENLSPQKAIEMSPQYSEN